LIRREAQTTMYAVVEERGRQYKVAPGQTVQIDLLDLQEGSSLEFDRVLLYSDGDDVRVGTPVLKDAKVKATVLGKVAGEKVVVMRFRRRKASRTKTGHRQKYTSVKIEEIVVS